MIELTLFLQIGMAFFATIGYLHGAYREFVATTGIILGLFLLTEFSWTINAVVGRGDASFRFIVDVILLTAFTFFAYQQAPTVFVPSRYRGSRGRANLPKYDNWQQRFMGAGLGAFNGYLIVGSLWYFMDQLEYPMSSLVSMPLLGSPSAEFVNKLPLVWLQQNDLLLFLVMGLFLLIIVFR